MDFFPRGQHFAMINTGQWCHINTDRYTICIVLLDFLEDCSKKHFKNAFLEIIESVIVCVENEIQYIKANGKTVGC